MKKLLLIVLCALCINAAEPKKESDGILIDRPLSGEIYIKGTGSTALQLEAKSTGGLSVYEQPAGEVLQVTGLAMIQLGNPSPYQGMRYSRPEKADDVKAVLTTKDGKRWVAKWVEETPVK